MFPHQSRGSTANMQSSYYKEFNFAYSFEEEGLKKIFKLLTDRIGETSLEVLCSNDITLKLNSIDGLLRYENAKDKEIKAITFFARDREKNRTAYVRLKGGAFDGISITIEARHDVVERTSNALRDIIMGSKTWYSLLYSAENYFLFIVYPAIFLIINSILISTWLSPALAKQKELEKGSFAYAFIVILFGIILYLVIGFLIMILRKYAFPKRSYLVGQAKKRHKALAIFQVAVIIGFVVSLTAGMVTSLLTFPTTTENSVTPAEPSVTHPAGQPQSDEQQSRNTARTPQTQ